MSTIGSTTPGVDRTALRDAAVGAATRGQPMVPSTYTVGSPLVLVAMGSVALDLVRDWSAGPVAR